MGIRRQRIVVTQEVLLLAVKNKNKETRDG